MRYVTVIFFFRDKLHKLAVADNNELERVLNNLQYCFSTLGQRAMKSK